MIPRELLVFPGWLIFVGLIALALLAYTAGVAFLVHKAWAFFNVGRRRVLALGATWEVGVDGLPVGLVCEDRRCPAGRAQRVHRDDHELMACAVLD